MRGTGPRPTGAGGAFFWCLARDRPSHYGEPRGRFFVVRGPVPRDLHLILAILIILAILLQTPSIDIKVLTDLFSVLRRRSIDIQVRWTCSRVLVAAVVRGPVPRARSAV